jgi:hypothetical protein
MCFFIYSWSYGRMSSSFGLEYMIDCLTYVDVYLFSFMGVFDSKNIFEFSDTMFRMQNVCFGANWMMTTTMQ